MFTSYCTKNALQNCHFINHSVVKEVDKAVILGNYLSIKTWSYTCFFREVRTRFGSLSPWQFVDIRLRHRLQFRPIKN